MNMRIGWKVAFVFLAIGLAGLAGGCEEKKAEVTTYFYYPDPPDPPRIQFLMSFDDVKAWMRSQRSSGSFEDFVLGTETKQATGSGAIRSPYGVACRDGKIYVCDLGANRVHVVDMVHQTYAPLGTAQQLTQPISICITPDGTKYVCDRMVPRIAVFDAQDRFVRTLLSPGNCTPLSAAVVGNEIFVVDSTDREVEVWNKDTGQYLRTIATRGEGPDRLGMPNDIVADSKGNLYVSDMLKSVVGVFNTKGQFLGNIGAPGDTVGYFARPKGMAIDPRDNLYVTDAQWDTVQIFDPARRILLSFGGPRPTPNGLGGPAGVAIGTDQASIDAFRKNLSPDFTPEYLVVVTNQTGNNKVCVFAFGKSKTAVYPVIPPPKPRPTTQPAAAATTKPAP